VTEQSCFTNNYDVRYRVLAAERERGAYRFRRNAPRVAGAVELEPQPEGAECFSAGSAYEPAPDPR
jgi:hypothetical protein